MAIVPCTPTCGWIRCVPHWFRRQSSVVTTHHTSHTTHHASTLFLHGNYSCRNGCNLRMERSASVRSHASASFIYLIPHAHLVLLPFTQLQFSWLRYPYKPYCLPDCLCLFLFLPSVGNWFQIPSISWSNLYIHLSEAGDLKLSITWLTDTKDVPCPPFTLSFSIFQSILSQSLTLSASLSGVAATFVLFSIEDD